MSIPSHSRFLPVCLSQLLLLTFPNATVAESLPSLLDVEQVFAGESVRDMDGNLRKLLDRIASCREAMTYDHVATLEEMIVRRAFGLRIPPKDEDYGELELILWKASNLKCCATNTVVMMAVASYLGDTRLSDESTCAAEFEEARKLDANLPPDTYGKYVRSPIERSVPSSPHLKACHLKWREIRNKNTQIRKHRKFVCSIIEPALKELLTHLDKQARGTFVSEFIRRAGLSPDEKKLLGI